MINPFFVLNLPLTLFCVFTLFISSIWLVRTFRRFRRLSQTTFLKADDPLSQIDEARAHLDASKRHIAALEETLNKIQDQLKRFPLS